MGIESLHEVRVIMTTALDDVKTVVSSYKDGATAYVVKPVDKQKLLEEVKNLKLLPQFMCLYEQFQVCFNHQPKLFQ